MAKKKTKKISRRLGNKNVRQIVVGAAIVGALGALAVIILLNPTNRASQSGVGADGFSVFEKKNADLHIDTIASKEVVLQASGATVKSVGDVSKSGVLSLNGSLGQTATYPVTLPDGTEGTIIVDVMQYKNQDTYDTADVFSGTGAAGTVNGREVRYLPAITLGKNREYALLVSKGTNSYKFALTQPANKVQIREYRAQEILKEVIKNSDLK